jgi:hypothetical protein
MTIDSGPGPVTNATGATFVFHSTESPVSFECSLDSGPYAPCSSPSSYAALVDGPHAFSVRVSDPAGNVRPQSWDWIVDTTLPTLTVNAPNNGLVTNVNPLNINGTVTDTNGIASLTIGTTTVTVAPNGSFSHALPLALDGVVTVTVVATDRAGNSVTVNRTVTYDTTMTAPTVAAPTDNSQTNIGTLTVRGTVGEPGTVAIRNSTTNTTMQAQLTGLDYSGAVQLASGSNTLEVTATDAVGNLSATVTRTVLYDPNSPALAITAPAHDIQVNAPAVTVTGTVSDATAVTVVLTFDGVTYPQTVVSGQFQQAITVPAEGSYPVTATATDGVGNTPTIVTRNIIYTPYPGDSNGDGATTTLVEVVKAFRHAFAAVPLTPTEELRLDCAPLGSDGKPAPNGVVDVADVILLLRRLVGLVTW